MGKRLLLLGAVLLAFVNSVEAALVSPLSYDMPNGETGTYNYWDEIYSPPTGSETTNGAPLAGGTGDLTDGIIAGASWNVTEAPPGNGPYVGWLAIQPTIQFHFGAPTLIDSITLYFDDPLGSAGGVDQPRSINLGFDGLAPVNLAIPGKGSNGPDSHTFSSLGTTASTVEITLFDGVVPWVFVSEVEFRDGVVPEPTTFAVWSLLGLCLTGAGWRRRSRAV